MQFDKTRIVIRERGMLDVFDLGLQVLREFFGSIAFMIVLGIAPFMLLNFGLCYWMLEPVYSQTFEMEYGWHILRYLWVISVLTYIEAPLAMSFLTAFLGQAVFVENLKLKDIIKDVNGTWLRLLWCHGIQRAVIPTIIFMLLMERDSEWQAGIDGVLLFFILFYLWIYRGLRPFISEIILLEKNPLRARTRADVSVGQRSSALHDPNMGELFVRGMVTTFVAFCLIWCVYGGLLFMKGVYFNDWSHSRWMGYFYFPLALWIVVGYLTVVRFLSYLDLRIRQEGWEVELLLRAEALRMNQKLASKMI
ncbi:MAG: hypothetical protein ACI9HK_004968 [Pirellulaceae bacterium]